MINQKFKANRPKVIGSTDMKPYWQVIQNIINDSSIVLEILDARMPELSRNEEIEQIVKNSGKKLILILNKADLVSENNLRKRLKILKKQYPTFVISNTQKLGTKRLREYLIAQAKNKEKFKVGILGYPNTGKSSVINSITMKRKAKVTSTAGTTHGQQWINFTNNMQIIDSPGVIPLKEYDEVRYALIGSRNTDKIKDLELVAHEIIKLFDDKTPIEKLYNVKIITKNPDEIINQIGIKKGFLKKGGVVNAGRTAIQIIRDWQSGKLRM
jgi:hypothetical protein